MKLSYYRLIQFGLLVTMLTACAGPKGDQGDMGYPGSQGEQGPKGDPGEPGITETNTTVCLDPVAVGPHRVKIRCGNMNVYLHGEIE